MAGFWELPAPDDVPGWCPGTILGSFRHTITHHLYTVTVLTGKLPVAPPGFQWRSTRALAQLPLTTIARKALRLMRALAKPDRVTANMGASVG